MDSIVADFSGYQSAYRQSARLQAIGERIPALVAANGKTYEEVEIRRVTDAGLDISHSGGPTRLRHDQLPAEFQDRFQWDETEAEVVFTREAEAERERARLHAEYRREQEELQKAAALAETDQRISSLERQLAAVASAAPATALGSSSRLGERRLLGSGYSARSRYYDRYCSRPTLYYYPVSAACYTNGGGVTYCRTIRPTAYRVTGGRSHAASSSAARWALPAVTRSVPRITTPPCR
jgi:hypothetical protein